MSTGGKCLFGALILFAGAGSVAGGAAHDNSGVGCGCMAVLALAGLVFVVIGIFCL